MWNQTLAPTSPTRTHGNVFRLREGFRTEKGTTTSVGSDPAPLRRYHKSPDRKTTFARRRDEASKDGPYSIPLLLRLPTLLLDNRAAHNNQIFLLLNRNSVGPEMYSVSARVSSIERKKP